MKVFVKIIELLFLIPISIIGGLLTIPLCLLLAFFYSLYLLVAIPAVVIQDILEIDLWDPF